MAILGASLEFKPLCVTAVGLASQKIAKRPQYCSATPTHLQDTTHVCASIYRIPALNFDAKSGLVAGQYITKAKHYSSVTVSILEASARRAFLQTTKTKTRIVI